MKRLYLPLFLMILALGLQAQTAKVQIIHNSPTPAADTVKVWLDDAVAIDSFVFRSATEFLDIPVASDISVTTFAATDTAGAVARIPGGTLMAGESYIAMASGEVGTDFAVRPFTPADTAADAETNVALLAFHGSPDAPAVDIDARGVADSLIDGLAYTAFDTGYVTVPAMSYILDVRADGSPGVVASFGADLSGLGGGAAVVFASGYLAPGMDQSAFGLFAALPTGDVVALDPLTTASVQVIHNSPTPAADTVKVWLDDAVAIDSFVFRSATGFLDIPVASDISVTTFAATDTAGAVARIPGGTLMAGESYIAMASGEVSTDFAVRPFTPATAEADTTTNVGLLAFHGSPDAPNVTVGARNVGPLFVNLGYTEFSPGYVNVPAFRYVLDVTDASTGDPISTHIADVQALAGQALTVFASGYATATGDSATFGLFAALPDGMVVELPQPDETFVQIIHNSPDPLVNIKVISEAGDTISFDSVAYRTATPFNALLPGEYAVRIETPAGDSVLQDTVEFLVGGTYAVIANGQLGNTERPFELAVTDMASTGSTVGGFDILLFHGSQDAPSVDLDFNAVNVPGLAPLFTIMDLAYGATEFIPIPPSGLILPEVFIAIRATGSDEVVKVYRVALPEIVATGESAAVAIASGFLGGDPESDTAFALLAVLPTGDVIALEEADIPVPVRELPNIVEDLVLFPNPVRDRAQVRFNLIEASQVQAEIFDLNGRRLQGLNLGNLPAGEFTEDFDTYNLPNGTYLYRLNTESGSLTTRFTVVK